MLLGRDEEPTWVRGLGLLGALAAIRPRDLRTLAFEDDTPLPLDALLSTFKRLDGGSLLHREIQKNW